MKSLVEKLRKNFGKGTLALLAVLFALIIIAQITIASGVLWLNTPQGQALIRTQIDRALADSDYKISYETLSYSFPDTINIINMELSDGEGKFLDIDRAAINIHPLSIAAKRAAISLKSNHVTLFRLPQKEEESESDAPALKPFTPPDMFFTTLSLDRLAIQTLDIREPVFGQPLMLSPTLRVKAELGQNINLIVNADIDQPEENRIEALPKTIHLNATLDPSTLEATLSQLSLETRSYEATASGTLNIGENGHINVTINGEIPDLSMLAAAQAGRADIKAQISGPLNAPVISSSGAVTLESLKAQGLSELLYTLETQNREGAWAGAVKISGAYKEIPVSARSNFSYTENRLALSEIEMSGPDLSASGDIAFDTQSLIADGKINIEAKNLETYALLTGQDIAGQIRADVTLEAKQAGEEKQSQSANINAIINNGRFETYTARRADIQAAFPDIKIFWPESFALDLRGAHMADNIKISRLKAGLRRADNTDYNLTLDGQGTLPQDFSLKGNAVLSGLTDSNPAARAIDMNFSSQGSSLHIGGAIDADNADIIVKTSNFNLQSLPVELPPSLQGVKITGTASLNGPLAQPIIKADFSSGILQIGKATPDLKLSVDANYSDGRATASFTGTGSSVKTLEGSIQIPATFTLKPFIFDMLGTAPLLGRIKADLDGRVLANAALPPDHNFTGALRAEASISGTIARPDITGTLAVNGGRYIYEAYNVTLNDIILRADIDAENVSVKTLTANDGKAGKLSGTGKISLQNPADTRLNMEINDFQILQGDQAKSTANANLDLRGREEGYSIGGTVDLSTMDIIIPEQFQSTIPELNIVRVHKDAEDDTAPPSVTLDIDLRAPRRIFVRGWGLDAEFGGDLDVTGTLREPQINGALQSQRGRYEEFGKRFNLTLSRHRGHHANRRHNGLRPSDRPHEPAGNKICFHAVLARRRGLVAHLVRQGYEPHHAVPGHPAHANAATFLRQRRRRF
jgi:translocation and assembly module TamB